MALINHGEVDFVCVVQDPLMRRSSKLPCERLDSVRRHSDPQKLILLRAVVAEPKKDEIKKMIDEVDQTGDGEIDFNE